MHRNQMLKTVLLAPIILAIASWAAADTEISWYTIDGGGGTSTGGGFELSGTIGQPDAGSPTLAMTGGEFELVGGFWPGAGSICSGPVLADFDHDCDVDVDDYLHFMACVTGPAIAQNDPTCADARLDGDTDVDQEDFALFQRCFSGTGVPPSCLMP